MHMAYESWMPENDPGRLYRPLALNTVSGRSDIAYTELHRLISYHDEVVIKEEDWMSRC